MNLYEIPNRDRTIDSEAEAYYGTEEAVHCEHCGKTIDADFDRDTVDLTLSTGTGRNLKMRLVKFCNDACWSRAMWDATQSDEERTELRSLVAALVMLSEVRLSRMPALEAYGGSGGMGHLIVEANLHRQRLEADGYEAAWTFPAREATDAVSEKLTARAAEELAEVSLG